MKGGPFVVEVAVTSATLSAPVGSAGSIAAEWSLFMLTPQEAKMRSVAESRLMPTSWSIVAEKRPSFVTWIAGNPGVTSRAESSPRSSIRFTHATLPPSGLKGSRPPLSRLP
jgi:hypothetical protein